MFSRLAATLGTVALTLTALAAPQASATSMDKTVPLHPAALDRGADVRVAHLEGKTIVDGNRRISLKARPVSLLGTSGTSYVVVVRRAPGDRQAVVRLNRSGRVTTLVPILRSSDAVLSRDGETVVHTNLSLRNRTRIRVLDATDGRRLRTRVFPGTVSVLDADQNQVILGSWAPNRTLRWNHSSNSTKQIVARTGYAANITANRFAFFTRDPHRNGCSLVSRLDPPTQVMWRSCRERVDQFSDNGKKLATVDILSDGIGPNVVSMRKTNGKLKARFTTRGWFGQLRWESNRALLLETNGKKKKATVRCVQRTCQRASDLRRTSEH